MDSLAKILKLSRCRVALSVLRVNTTMVDSSNLFASKSVKNKGKYHDSRVFRVSEYTFLLGAPEAIRTPDPFLRREVLYPAELRTQRGYCTTIFRSLHSRFDECFIDSFDSGISVVCCLPSPTGFSLYRSEEKAITRDQRN